MPERPLVRAVWLALLLMASAVGAAEIRVELDRSRVGIDDVVSLRLIAEGDAQGEPDFAPLNQDFDILDRGQSEVTSIVNGDISHTRQWTLELSPKKTGRIEIQAITLGQDKSRPAVVEVVAGPPGLSTADVRPLFVKAETGVQDPYVQQAFEYCVKVYFREPPLRASLSDPTADGATIQPFGKDRSDSESVGGQPYQVIERRYLVIPQRSGRLTIQGPRLDAVVADRSHGPRDDPFAELDQAFGGSAFQGFPNISGLGARGRRVVERAPDVALRVRAQPAGSASPWLPATSVRIAEEWTPNPPVFRVGEPVTRTLTLTAEGTTAAQLPNIDPGRLDGAQVYADQPKSEALTGASRPTAVKHVKVALVPTRPGPLTLPEIRLAWWDTTADVPRTEVVPARTVQVSPAAGEHPALAMPPAAAVDQTPAGTELAQAPESPSPGSPAGQGTAGSGMAGIWPWLALLFGVAWLATLVWWRWERRSRRAATSPRPVSEKAQEPSRRAAAKALEQSCVAGDASAARKALLVWARLRWPESPPNGLRELGARLNDAGATEELRMLDRALYTASTQAWDGPAAWARLATLFDEERGPQDAEASDGLPDLYPRV